MPGTDRISPSGDGAAESSDFDQHGRVGEVAADRSHPFNRESRVAVVGERSISWFRENVKLLRPSYRPPDPGDRLTWEPGEAAQCDLWFPPKRIPLEDGTASLLPTLVMTAAHSRFMTGQMIPTRKTEDLLLGSWELIPQLGRVPGRLIWDNEPGIGRGVRRADGVAAFMGT